MGKAEAVQTARICKVSTNNGDRPDSEPELEQTNEFFTFRDGVVDGLARALGQPIQLAGSWLARNPVGAWVGRSFTISHNMQMYQVGLFWFEG